MADPLSLIAGIAGIAAASAQLANAVYSLSDKLMHAPLEIRNIASNMALLSSILENLAQVLEQGKDVYKPHLLLEAESILQKMKDVQRDVAKMVKRQTGVRARFKWVLSYKKVAELGARIEALKSALGLVLWTVQLAMWKRDPGREENKGARLKNLVEAVMKQNRQSIISVKQRHQAPPPPFSPPYPPWYAHPPDYSSPYNDKLQIPDNKVSGLPSNEQNAAGLPSHDIQPYNRPPNHMEHPSTPLPNQFAHHQTSAESRAEDETAVWLYRLSFTPWLDPDGKGQDGRDNENKEKQLILPAIPRLQVLSIPSAVGDVLDAWTVLDKDEINSVRLAGYGYDESLVEEKNGENSDRNVSSDEEEEYSDTEALLQSYPGIRRPMLKSSNSEPGKVDYPSGQSSYDQNGFRHHTVPLPPQPPTPRGSMHETTGVPPPPPPPPPAPQPPSQEESMLNKLEKLLLEKEKKEQAKAEDAKFSRLEQLLIEQQKARNERDAARRKAAEDAANAAREAKKRGDADKLEKLEKLILAQRDEQLKREAAVEAMRAAEKAEIEAMAVKEAEEKRAAAEAAAKLLRAAQNARAEAEAKAAKESEEAQMKAMQQKDKEFAELKKGLKDLYEEEVREEKALRTKLEEHYEMEMKLGDELAQTRMNMLHKEIKNLKKEEEALRYVSVALIDKMNEDKPQQRERTFASLDGKSTIVTGKARTSAQLLELLKERNRLIDDTSTTVSSLSEDNEEKKLETRRAIRRCRRQLATLERQLAEVDDEDDAKERIRSETETVRFRLGRLLRRESELEDESLSPADRRKRQYSSAVPPPPAPPVEGPSVTSVLSPPSPPSPRSPPPPPPPPPPPRPFVPLSIYDSSDDEDGEDDEYVKYEYHIMFNTYLNPDNERLNAINKALDKHKIASFFERKAESSSLSLSMSDDESESLGTLNERAISGSLMWTPSLAHGRSELFDALCDSGWKPIYVRGSGAGQTWFHGPHPIHVRFQDPTYIPSLPHIPQTPAQRYCLVGSEWVAEDAFQLMGVEYKLLPSGFWMLPPDIVYDEILSLISMSFTLREAGLRRSARRVLDKGSLRLVEAGVEKGFNTGDGGGGSVDDIPRLALAADIDSP